MRFIFLLVFFLSGFAGLIYQIVWQRVLTTYFGVENISFTLIVSIFMFGLGIGSIIGGIIADRSKHNVLIYSAIEVVLGLFGFISISYINLIGENTAGSNYVLSGILIFLFLSIPTILMGMTLPILVKIYNRLCDDYLNSISVLYFINTLGAAIGSLVSSFVLISIWGLGGALNVAIFINFLLFGILLFTNSRSKKSTKVTSPVASVITSDTSFARKAYVYVFITGFLAIAYEIIWFRIISILTKSSPYALSSVLFMYLLGIALGSLLINLLVKNVEFDFIEKRNLFFKIQVLIALSVFTIFLLFFILSKTGFNDLIELSYNTILHPDPNFENIWQLIDIMAWPAYFILIPTLLIGASFPLITSLTLNKKGTEGTSLGSIYLSNILGNVLGGIVTGFILLKYIGTEVSILILIITGLLFLFLEKSNPFLSILKLGSVFVITFCLFLIPNAKGKFYDIIFPENLIATGDIKFFNEDENGISQVYSNSGNRSRAVINGLGHGIRPGLSFHQKALSVISRKPTAQNILIIGFGAGNFVEVSALLPNNPQITIVELNANHIITQRNVPEIDAIFKDNVELIIDDGRRYLNRTDKKFDIIMMDPLRSTTSFSNNIYSSNFFELIKNHLKKNGLLYSFHDEQYMSKTLATVFPYSIHYPSFSLSSNDQINDINFDFYNMIIDKHYSEADKAKLNFDDKTYLFIGDGDAVLEKFKDYPINDDLNPVNEYFLSKVYRSWFND